MELAFCWEGPEAFCTKVTITGSQWVQISRLYPRKLFISPATPVSAHVSNRRKQGLSHRITKRNAPPPPKQKRSDWLPQSSVGATHRGCVFHDTWEQRCWGLLLAGLPRGWLGAQALRLLAGLWLPQGLIRELWQSLGFRVRRLRFQWLQLLTEGLLGFQVVCGRA